MNRLSANAGYVVVSVENGEALDVWFDDLRVVAAEDMAVQENHYDPFGQNLPDIEMTGSPDCPNQYTGKERIAEEGLEWADYGGPAVRRAARTLARFRPGGAVRLALRGHGQQRQKPTHPSSEARNASALTRCVCCFSVLILSNVETSIPRRGF